MESWSLELIAAINGCPAPAARLHCYHEPGTKGTDSFAFNS